MKTTIPIHLERRDTATTRRLFQLHGLLTKPILAGRCELTFDESPNEVAAIDRRDLNGSGLPTPRGVALLSDEIRPYSNVMRAGARLVSLPAGGPETNLPSIDRTLRGGWGNTPPAVEPSTPLTLVSPKRVWATISVSDQLAKQTGVIGTAFVMRQLYAALGSSIDAAALAGDGLEEPLGIFTDPTVYSDPGTGAMTLARLASMERHITESFGDFGSLSLVTAADVKESMRTITAGDGVLWDQMADITKMGSALMPAGGLILGDFNELVIVHWGNIDVLANPFSRDTEGIVRLTASAWCDVAPLRAEAFANATTAP